MPVGQRRRRGRRAAARTSRARRGRGGAARRRRASARSPGSRSRARAGRSRAPRRCSRCTMRAARSIEVAATPRSTRAPASSAVVAVADEHRVEVGVADRVLGDEHPVVRLDVLAGDDGERDGAAPHGGQQLLDEAGADGSVADEDDPECGSCGDSGSPTRRVTRTTLVLNSGIDEIGSTASQVSRFAALRRRRSGTAGTPCRGGCRCVSRDPAAHAAPPVRELARASPSSMPRSLRGDRMHLRDELGLRRRRARARAGSARRSGSARAAAR